MVSITRVYTRKGDDGRTSISKATRLSKNSIQIEVLGLLDELNAFLGWTAILITDNDLSELKKQLLNIQNTLFDVGAYLCKNNKKEFFAKFFSEEVKNLEQSIDEMNTKLKPLTSFILPGGNEISARFQIARTVCRRTERKLVAFQEEHKDNLVIPYINRLSDWLFVAARFALHATKTEELLWVPIWDK